MFEAILEYIQPTHIAQHLLQVSVARNYPVLARTALSLGANPHGPSPTIVSYRSSSIVLCDKKKLSEAQQYDFPAALRAVFSPELAMVGCDSRTFGDKLCGTYVASNEICTHFSMGILESFVSLATVQGVIEWARQSYEVYGKKNLNLNIEYRAGYSSTWSYPSMMIHAIKNRDSAVVQALHDYGASIYYVDYNKNCHVNYNNNECYIREHINSADRAWLCEIKLPVVPDCANQPNAELCCKPDM